MVTTLAFKAVLLLGIARCASTGENSIHMKAARSKRDSTKPVGSIIWSTRSSDTPGKQYIVPYSDTSVSPSEALQAETTVHTIPAYDSPIRPAYAPYQQHDVVLPGDQLSERIKTTQPTLTGGFQASNLQTVPNRFSQNGHKVRSTSHTPQANNQFPNKASKGANERYFVNPSNYRLIPESSKVSTQLRSGSLPASGANFPAFPKFKSSISGPTYVDHSFKTQPKYRFGPGATFNSHSTAPLIPSSQRHNAPPHKSTTSYPVPKNIVTPSSSFHTEFTSTPSIDSSEKPGQNYRPYVSASSNEHPVDKSPASLSLQSSPDISSLIRAFENEPVILSTGLDYQTHPSSSGLSYDYPKPRYPKLSNGPGSVSTNNGNYQPRILPIHSSSSTPEIPQYQGASVNGFSANRYGGPLDGYQQIANQPQFHFTANNPQIVHHSRPSEAIRTDVEVIEKKRTTTPKPYDSEEHDFDQDFKTGGRDFSYTTGDDGERSRPSKARDDSYELPRSNLFNSYDDAFGRYSKLAAIEQDITEKRAPPKVNEPAKPVYQSIEEEEAEEEDEEEEEEEDGKNNDSRSSGEYRSGYDEEKEPNASYEDEDEEESRRSERQGSYEGRDERVDDDGEHGPYKSYGEDFEKDFEESYRKDPPKNDYAHVKEVPEIEESRSESKKYVGNRPSTKTTGIGSGQKPRRTVRGDYAEPKKYGSSKVSYDDSEGHGSKTSYERTKIKKPRLEDSYGYKIPRDRGVTRFGKNRETDTRKRNAESTTSNNTSNDRDATQGHHDESSSVTPLTSATGSNESHLSYPFSTTIGRWKPSKSLTGDRDTYVASSQDVRTIFKTENSPYPLTQVHRDGSTYSSDGRIVRGFTGI